MQFIVNNNVFLLAPVCDICLTQIGYYPTHVSDDSISIIHNDFKTIMNSEMTYLVVINDEEQYSIWPSFKNAPPAGWRCIGFEGDKAACLQLINELWTDMRPKSVREAEASMAERVSS